MRCYYANQCVGEQVDDYVGVGGWTGTAAVIVLELEQGGRAVFLFYFTVDSNRKGFLCARVFRQ